MKDERNDVVLLNARQIAVLMERADADRLSISSPFGMVELAGGVYGLVLATGDDEAWAIKLQLPDMDLDSAERGIDVLTVLAAGAAAQLSADGQTGLVIPIPYIREKQPGMAEIGVAVFAWPDKLDDDYEKWLWKVATLVAQALPAGVPGFELPALPQFVGLDPRPRSALGTLFPEAGVLDGELLLLRHTRPEPEEPVWAALGDRSELRHVPLIAMALTSGTEDSGGGL
jgi:hypothetical protein